MRNVKSWSFIGIFALLLAGCVNDVEEHPMYPQQEQDALDNQPQDVEVITDELVFNDFSQEYRVDARVINQETQGKQGSGNELVEDIESIVVPIDAVVSTSDENEMLSITGNGYNYGYEFMESKYMEMVSIVQNFRKAIVEFEPNYDVEVKDLYVADYEGISDFDYFIEAEREHEIMYLLLKEENRDDGLYLHYTAISMSKEVANEELLRTIVASIASIELKD
ncbi:hypothetical protein [Alkalihalobacillus pseudalcaliphilus]|uniref:hypothetical protein n=1 Tax=Alkalihalobacillus pseudalcaliphilus TaxID=79884 RepID=UPI00064DF41D|nr:hypothetical protein [Alkalihalobacillus pseudalcaliphilus]KMK76168.1 hypothetical protein AB990_13175 [Alkalihalobacillus pseudalcaliphilus]